MQYVKTQIRGKWHFVLNVKLFFLLSPFSLLPIFFLTLWLSFVPTECVLLWSQCLFKYTFNYVDECKRARVRKGQKFFFWTFSHFFFIDSIILTCVFVYFYVVYERISEGFVLVYICAVAFQCGLLV